MLGAALPDNRADALANAAEAAILPTPTETGQRATDQLLLRHRDLDASQRPRPAALPYSLRGAQGQGRH